MKRCAALIIGGLCFIETAAGEILLQETFAYENPTLTANGIWSTHSGVAGEVNLVNDQVELTAAETEDVNAELSASFGPDSNAILYAAFTVQLSSLPSSGGSYFAHFMLGGATLRGRVFASRGNAADGMFRLGVANGGEGEPVEFDRDLALETTYLVVIRYEVSNVVTTLWIDPADESDPAITAFDREELDAIAAFGLRQSTGIGTLLLDNLTVATTFQEVLDAAAETPTILMQSADPTAFESGPTPAVIEFSRTGITHQPLTLQLEFFGTVENGVDIENLESALTIGAGESSVMLQILPRDDAEVESAEHFTVRLAENAAYEIGSPEGVEVLLLDNDSPDLLLEETFYFPSAAPLVEQPSSRWITHSGGAGEILAGGSSRGIQLTSSGGLTEDVSAPLAGAPYEQDEAMTLYSSFYLRFTRLPSAGGTYFAHFMGGTSSQRGRVFAHRNGAAEGMFRLSIGNGASRSGDAMMHPMDLSLETDYLIVTRYEVSTATTALWIDPAAEDDGGVSATDGADARDILVYAFRQSSGLGTLHVTKLRIGSSWQAVNPLTETGPGPAGPATFLSPRWSDESGIRLTLQGTLGATYAVEFSEDFANWELVEEREIDDGENVIDDAIHRLLPRGFYRARLVQQ